MLTHPLRRTPKAKPEEQVSQIDWARGILATKAGRKEANIAAGSRNAFIQDSSDDTIHYVACGLKAISRLTFEEGEGCDTDTQFGMYLLHKVMMDALEVSKVQMQNERKEAHARGIVALHEELAKKTPTPPPSKKAVARVRKAADELVKDYAKGKRGAK